MQGTVRAIRKLTEEDEIDLLRKLDYIGCKPQDIPLYDKLDKIQEKIKNIDVLDMAISEAMLIKTSNL